ncbi:hypothetical protein EFR39_05995 [Limosilactobacillus fermentum]|uniref:hypothetical protein n=1 Tax=Limosilactobacillus fermentum TaxID=1613 RepID=UPI0021A2811D|nr:hypothetical protein [Limosilactobacillus fermentum]MCT3449658.1 hypothetical protein [Limosilactobacillus fermentum]MCT3453502.1 hypothetical protein [Limosilactobacillus fermentum]MCT3455519.1 hypothetical protein [Limosilactobacillus fermentum]MCT3459558.1 hypothetical protein [Limosilactobacillus fermentum]MCT3461215.1 hypothetical protein [Limosilactobacillus fermentum]
MIEVPTFVIISIAVIIILSAVAVLVAVIRRSDHKIADNPAADLDSEQWLPDYSDSKVSAEKITLGYIQEVDLSDDLDMSQYRPMPNSGRLLSTISQTLPATFSVTSALASEVAEKAGSGAYQVIMQSGQSLMHSKNGENLYKGITQAAGHCGIAGSADLKPINSTASELAAKTGAVAGVMAVASMVVGQYYMTEINGKLESISESIDDIKNFQKTELLAQISTVVRESRQLSVYNDEIMESASERQLARHRASDFEEKSGELLDQINSLIRLELVPSGKFSEYERHTRGLVPLLSSQQVLVATLRELSRLTVVLSRSEVSPERAGATYKELVASSEKVRDNVVEWHSKETDVWHVNLARESRAKTGIKKVVSQPLTLVNPELAYQHVPSEFIKQVQTQSSMRQPELPEMTGYQVPVDLLIQNNQVYYRAPESFDKDDH